MSVCVMKKLTVLAPQRDADRLVRRLMRLRCAELSAVPLGDLPDGGTLLRYDCDTARAEAERRVAAVTAALPLLDAYTVKAKPWNQKPIAVTAEEFRASGRFDAARRTVEEILALGERRVTDKNEYNRLNALCRSLSPWLEYQQPLSGESTALTEVWLGTLPGKTLLSEVDDALVRRIQARVYEGKMGFIALHSGHHSKPFRRLMGTGADLGWREDGDRERLWIINYNHPIMAGIEGRYFELEGEETYTEPFGIPDPDKLLLIGWYNGGEVFRSGCIWHRENGKVFYLQPGHETYPTFYNENIQRIITNAVRWAKPVYRVPALECPWVARIEEK